MGGALAVTAIMGLLGAIGQGVSAGVGAKKSSELGTQAMDSVKSGYQNANTLLQSRYNGDYVNRTEVQAYLSGLKSALNDRYKRARQTNVVSGGTDESLALMQQADNKALADATSSVASSASNNRDALANKIASQYASEGNAMATVYGNQAKQVSSSADSAGKAFQSLGDLGANIGKVMAG